MAEQPKRTKKGTFMPGTSGNPSGKRRKDAGWGGTWSGINQALNDKRLGNDIMPTALSYQQLVDLFETDDLGERAAKAPVDDATRQGYEISIADDDDFDDFKSDVETQLRKWEVMKVIKRALYQKRALGGSAILIGTNDYKPLTKPLDVEGLSSIKFLTVLEPMMLTPYLWYDNPIEPKFGEVKIWAINTSNTAAASTSALKTVSNELQAASQYVHESRLLILNNDKISAHSANMSPAGDYWGPSIYTKLYDILRDFNISWAAAGLIVTDFSQGVFSIDGLANLVMRNEKLLVDRMRALETGRSVARSIVIDKEHEAFERKSTNVSGLSDLLHQLSRRLAAAIDIPLSVLMGGAEKTDKAEMTNELRYYYDKCASIQAEEIDPLLRFFIEVAMRGLRQRKLPKKWCIRWHPLWQLTDEQKANARLAQARVDAIYIEHGVLDPQTVAMLRFGGEYSYDTVVSGTFQAPGFMALPPMGVLVDGVDPNTGLPPGEQPPPAIPGEPKKAPPNKVLSGGGGPSAVAVKPHARNAPRRTNMAKSTYSQAGGATPGKLRDAEDPEHCAMTHDTVGELAQCEHCVNCDECGKRSAMHIAGEE